MSQSNDAITAAVKKQFQNYTNAYLAHDTAALEKILHDDLVHFHSNGRIDDKKSAIAFVGAGELKNLNRVNNNILVRVYGDGMVAVLTTRAQNTTMFQNTTKVNDVLITTVWARPSKESDNWQLVSWGAGPANDSPAYK
jgi:hypothetical protein